MTITSELLDFLDGRGYTDRYLIPLLELAALVEAALAEGNEFLDKRAFTEQYATHSGLTVEELHSLGLKAYPCDCGEPGCEGWRMITGMSQHAPKRCIIGWEID